MITPHFVHPFTTNVDGHLDYFQFGANNPAVNIHVQVFGHMCQFLLGIHLVVELLNYMLSLCLTF